MDPFTFYTCTAIFFLHLQELRDAIDEQLARDEQFVAQIAKINDIDVQIGQIAKVKEIESDMSQEEDE